MLYKSKEWYLKGFCIEAQNFRIYKINRIIEIEVINESFIPIIFPNTAKKHEKYNKVVLNLKKCIISSVR